jgi:hypothetical protein
MSCSRQSIDEVVEDVRRRYILVDLSTCRVRVAGRVGHDLGYGSPGDGVGGAEGAVRVPTQYASASKTPDVVVER